MGVHRKKVNIPVFSPPHKCLKACIYKSTFTLTYNCEAMVN